MREDLKEAGMGLVVFIAVALVAVALCQADEPAPLPSGETQGERGDGVALRQ